MFEKTNAGCSSVKENRVPFKRLCLLACLLMLVSGIDAQFNTKAGYMVGWLNPGQYNEGLVAFNQDKTWLDDDFQELKLLQMINLGGRYRFGAIGLELSYRYGFNSTKATGIDPVDNSDLYQKLFYRKTGLSFGVENFIGNFSYGASLDVDRFRIKYADRENGNKTDLINEQLVGNTFFIGFNSPGESFLSLSFRPYIQVYWNEVDFQPALNQIEPLATDKALENLFSFGLQVIFYNGN